MYTINSDTFYRQVCASPNHAESIQFNADGIQSSCRRILLLEVGSSQLACKVPWLFFNYLKADKATIFSDRLKSQYSNSALSVCVVLVME